MRRTSSAYFSFCNAHHVPDVTDLVIVELDVDDDGYVFLSKLDTETDGNQHILQRQAVNGQL